MRRVAALMICLSLTVPSLGALRPTNWEQWRGPKRDGKSTDKGLLKKWPSAGPKLLWKNTETGEGYASVVVGGDLVYTAGKRGGSLVITALDMSGRKVWQVDHGRAWTKNYPGSRGTPTYDNGLLYVLSGHGSLVCYDARSGSKKWNVDITSQFGGRPANWGYSEAPLVNASYVAVTPGGSKCIVALNKRTGSPIWTSSGFNHPAHYASLIEFEYQGVPMLATLTSRSMVAVNAKTGRFLWENLRAAGRTAVCPSPVYENGYVFGASGYGNGGACVKLVVSGGQVRADQVWETKDMVNHHGGYVVVDGYIYGHSDRGGWTCLELSSGRKMWSDRGVGKGSVCWADGMLYTYSENGGRLALVEAKTSGYAAAGEIRVDGPPREKRVKSWAHPVVTGGRLYVRYWDVLSVYDVGDQNYRPPAPPRPKVVTPPSRATSRPETSWRRPSRSLPPATPEVKAKRMLSMARNFLANGARTMAKRKLEELVKKYPDTETAETARDMLRDM